MIDENLSHQPIAIIGMAGRFPKAKTKELFWQLLKAGGEVVEKIPQVMIDSRTNPDGSLPSEFVPMGIYLEDVDYFDYPLFELTQREAMIMDPQQRLFVEQVWAAIEDAGYEPSKLGENVAVYSGAGPSRHALDAMAVFGHDGATMFEVIAMGIDKPMSMRVSHLFDFKGESVYIYAACATSLVAIDMGFWALQNGRADVAIAGASVVYLPQMEGYDYAEGAVRSSDGHCRAFDSLADGTVWGNGVGVVVLKRLSDALRDGDQVHAVILGSAVNNDGKSKASFAAPSKEGQASVIRKAMQYAGVRPQEISYIEGHGTGTTLGDPIEVDALNDVFGRSQPAGHCLLGSVKPNIGHLDPAAGIAGLLKTVLAMQNQELPGTVNFKIPNPNIAFANGPFRVTSELTPWPKKGHLRHAGVNSFGVGGTNAHVVLREAPTEKIRPACARRAHLITLSARSPMALETMRSQLIEHLKNHASLQLRDVAFTRNVGRKRFEYSFAFSAESTADLIRCLQRSASDPLAPPSSATQGGVALIFPGQGSQVLDMTAELYASEPDYKATLDGLIEFLTPMLGKDIRDIIFPDVGLEEEAKALLNSTRYQQPILFAISYSLAQLFAKWGVVWDTMIGHSVGEYVAATLAGVFSPISAMTVLVERARLMDTCPGAMLAVSMPEDELLHLLPPDLEIAAINSSMSCVVSGNANAIDSFGREIRERGERAVLLPTSGAFHSRAMADAAGKFRAIFREVELHKPTKTWISTVTGSDIEPQRVMDPEYWIEQLLLTVQFKRAVETALCRGVSTFVELGGSQILGGLILHSASERELKHVAVVSATPHPKKTEQAAIAYLEALGTLWKNGASIDWEAFHKHDNARRVSLPHYPFEGAWVGLGTEGKTASAAAFRTKTSVSQEPLPATKLEGFHAIAHDIRRSPRPHMATQEYVRPEEETEKNIAEIFSRVLGIERIGLYDDFYALGGSSIMLVHLVNQLRGVFGIKVTIRQIAANPSPHKLAAVVRANLSHVS